MHGNLGNARTIPFILKANIPFVNRRFTIVGPPPIHSPIWVTVVLSIPLFLDNLFRWGIGIWSTC